MNFDFHRFVPINLYHCFLIATFLVWWLLSCVLVEFEMVTFLLVLGVVATFLPSFLWWQVSFSAVATFLPGFWCGGYFPACFFVWWQGFSMWWLLSCQVFGVAASGDEESTELAADHWVHNYSGVP